MIPLPGRKSRKGLERILARPIFYVLEGRVPLPCNDPDSWAEKFDWKNRNVADDTIGDVRVSTIFLGIDSSYSFHGPPILFETVVFGGTFDDEQYRYSTWEQAEKGHATVVAKVKADQLKLVKVVREEDF